MNIDEKEINNFDSFAHEWWNKRGPYKLIHNLTPLRLDYIQQHLDIKNSNILDIGCGGGILAEELTDRGANVTGLDASKKTIQIAKDHAKEKNFNVNYLNTSLEDHIKKNNQKYDAIVCFELIEHVPDQLKLIQDISSICKKGTKVFLSTINRNITSFALAKIMAEYILKIVPEGTHQYKKFIKPSELAKMLEMVDLNIDNIKGVKLNPIDYSFTYSSITKINYFMTATKK
jgi:2-polyprenyl-6-hydroxyphenyl methylase / 3-demethylubiquinone-9 3-methyltransferase